MKDKSNDGRFIFELYSLNNYSNGSLNRDYVKYGSRWSIDTHVHMYTTKKRRVRELRQYTSYKRWFAADLGGDAPGPWEGVAGGYPSP